MRIGITAHNYPPHLGGMEAIVRELARRMARSHEVVVVSTEWNGLTGVFHEDGMCVHRLPAFHGLERRGVPYTVPFGPGVSAAWRALRQCDVLHAHGSLYLTTLLACLAASGERRLFVTEHVGLVPYQSAGLMALQRLAWRLVGDAVIRRSIRTITYNARICEDLKSRFGPSAITFIPNGVDTEQFRPCPTPERRAARERFGLPRDEVLALFVGRDTPKKNLEPVLCFERIGYRLVVCGAERALPERVLNLGALPHRVMPDLFAAVDFMIHAAVGEGFPVAVQEAMASGLTVALLWDAGYSGAVDRNVVCAVDTLHDLEQAAARIASDERLRESTGFRSREYALRQWNWDVAVERHLELFTSTRDMNRDAE